MTDDIFVSPPRNYEMMHSWLHSPNDGEMRPISRLQGRLATSRAVTGHQTHRGLLTIH